MRDHCLLQAHRAVLKVALHKKQIRKRPQQIRKHPQQKANRKTHGPTYVKK